MKAVGVPRRHIGTRIAPVRFLAFLGVFVAVALGWRTAGRGDWSDALTLGFDAAAALFLISLIPILRDRDTARLRRHARDNDANRVLVLVITVAIVLAVLAAVTGELPAAARGDPGALARLIATLVLAWLFANAAYALHYAHLYYGSGHPGDDGPDRQGLDFPGKAAPDFADFLYFAATLGMTFQTSDVTITAPHMRRVVTGHALIAFVFNLGIVALVINALGGLAGGPTGMGS